MEQPAGPAPVPESGPAPVPESEPGRMPGSAPVPGTEPARPRAIRASDQDREAVVQRLQAAFAEGRLDDDEFDRRMRAALTAKTSSNLTPLLDDLPAAAGQPTAALTAERKPGRFAVAVKSSIRRGGRWQVPDRFTSVVYKGGGLLDLRAAELTAHVTTVVAIAYKSRIDILVPPGIRVEMEGFGVTKGWSAGEDRESQLPRDAPVVHIRGLAYKGTIEASTRPPARADAPPAIGR